MTCVAPQADPAAGQTYAGGIAPARQPGAESGVSSSKETYLVLPQNCKPTLDFPAYSALVKAHTSGNSRSWHLHSPCPLVCLEASSTLCPEIYKPLRQVGSRNKCVSTHLYAHMHLYTHEQTQPPSPHRFLKHFFVLFWSRTKMQIDKV